MTFASGDTNQLKYTGTLGILVSANEASLTPVPIRNANKWGKMVTPLGGIDQSVIPERLRGRHCSPWVNLQYGALQTRLAIHVVRN